MQAEPVTTRHRHVTREAKFTNSHVLSHSVRPTLRPAPTYKDVSFNLVSTTIQLCARTQESLDRFSRKNETIDELFESVRAIGEAFERFEQIAFDVDDLLDEEELEKLEEIAIASIHNFNAINLILDSAITKGPSHPSKRLVVSSTHLGSLMAEKPQVITSSVAQLSALLLKIEV
jgi:hypothetical protein